MTSPAAPPPSMNDMLTIIAALRGGTPPTPTSPGSEKEGTTKLVVGGVISMIGAIMLGLIFWVGSSVNGLSTSVTKMSANVDQLQKSISDLQQSQGTTSQQLSDGKAVNARQDARMDAVDADINRMKERLRIVEGQKPLPDGLASRPAYQ